MPRQNGRHYAEDSFNFIFLYENCCIVIKISCDEPLPESGRRTGLINKKLHLEILHQDYIAKQY